MRLAANFHRFTRTVTIESADGLQSAPISVNIRGLTQAEQVGSIDQDEMMLVALMSDLEAVGFYPLPKYARIIDGPRTYSVVGDRDVWTGASGAFTKARIKG